MTASSVTGPALTSDPASASVAPASASAPAAPVARGAIEPYALAAAVAALRAGDLVAFATETVYGLGGDARNERALRKIFELKGRPAEHPLILHLASVAELPSWVAEVPQSASALAAAFWPGPLTLVLRRHPTVSPVLTGGQDSIAIRVPAHPVAQALLQAFGSGIAAPSANRYGHVSPTSAAHVRDEFGDAIPVLEGGDCELGVESTILSLLETPPRILRPGMISGAAIERVLHGAVAGPASSSAAGSSRPVPRVPGSTLQHYAPRTPVSLLPSEPLQQAVARACTAGIPVVVFAHQPPSAQVREAVSRSASLLRWVQAAPTAGGYAHELYARLREFDKQGAERIFIECVPDDPAWDAVRDRLQRAAAGDSPSP